MPFETLTREIESRMAANWSATPIAYENVPFTPDNDPWIRLTVVNGAGLTLGVTGSTPAVRDSGLISVQVFVPEGTGSQQAKALVDLVLPIYEHTRFSGILAYTATINPAGTFDGWHQTNITIPFRRVRNV